MFDWITKAKQYMADGRRLKEQEALLCEAKRRLVKIDKRLEEKQVEKENARVVGVLKPWQSYADQHYPGCHIPDRRLYGYMRSGYYDQDRSTLEGRSVHAFSIISQCLCDIQILEGLEIELDRTRYIAILQERLDKQFVIVEALNEEFAHIEKERATYASQGTPT